MIRKSGCVLLFLAIACFSNDGVAGSHLEELFNSEAGQASEANAPALWARAVAARELAIRAARSERLDAAADHRTAARLWLSAAIVRSETLQVRDANAERLAAAAEAESRILTIERQAEVFENQLRQERANRYGETTAANAHERATRDEARRSRQSEEANIERDAALADRVRALFQVTKALNPDIELEQVRGALQLARRTRRPANLREALDEAYWVALTAYSASLRARSLPSCQQWIESLSFEPDALIRTTTGLHFSASGLFDSSDSQTWSDLIERAPRPSLIFVNVGGSASNRAPRFQQLRDNTSASSSAAIELIASPAVSREPSVQLPCL